MQNTMAAGKRIKNEYLGGENEKGERKTEEITMIEIHNIYP